ncbi:hypothetical protein [Pedobacter heparinus]|uniref:hypothetical protein n=1 Tax=Pedobacter heparinus TaxID=984 RepID=UPI00292EB7D8|nr:hypothetical protein [Pedobacter heparinus]
MAKKQKKIESGLYLQGRAFEGEKSYAEAARQYEKILKANPLHIEASNRLMIVYRKLKLHRKESALISKAIAAHEKDIEVKQQQWIKEHSKMAELSRPLARSLGLLTSKGLPVQENELLIKWKLRKAVVDKKLKQDKK